MLHIWAVPMEKRPLCPELMSYQKKDGMHGKTSTFQKKKVFFYLKG